MSAIALIYGESVLADIEFCAQHESTLGRYEHGIMTLLGSPTPTLETVAGNPLVIRGWSGLLAEHPEDVPVLREFFRRLIDHREDCRNGRGAG